MLWGHNRTLGCVYHHVVFGPKFNFRMTGLVVGHQILSATFFQVLTHTFFLPHQTGFPPDFSAAVEAAAKHCEQE